MDSPQITQITEMMNIPFMLKEFNPSTWYRFFLLSLGKTLDGILWTTKWRNLSTGISDEIPIIGWPIFPQMTYYTEVNGGLWEFLQTPNTTISCLTSVINITVTLPILFFAFRTFKSRFIPYMSSIGRKIGSDTHGKEWVAKNEEKMTKFGEYCFRLLYHSSMSIFALHFFWDAPWFWDYNQMWFEFYSYPVTVRLSWYLLIQCAYNLDAFVSLIELSVSCKSTFPFVRWSPTCRGDFVEMAVHHFVTNALLLTSSYFRAIRFGAMTLILHDISDVPIDMSKLANFLKWKKATICCFGIMLVSWIIFRLAIYPYMLIQAGYFGSFVVRDNYGMEADMFLLYQRWLNIGLSCLVLLHYWWFSMFVKMGIILVTKGETHDLSEHKKGEKQS